MAVYAFEHSSAINSDKLDADLKALNAAVSGFVFENGMVRVIATRELTDQERQSIEASVTAHNPTVMTEAQQRESVRLLALQALQGNKLALVLAAIASDASDIDTDLTALGNLAVLSLLTFRPLMTRLLNRQARIENRLEMVFKILSHE